MTTSPHPRPKEIWLAYLHVIDKPAVGKVRSVLVLDALPVEGICIAAKITTSAVPLERGAVMYAIRAWEACGLRKPSFIRLDQRFEVPYADLLRGNPLGVLSGADARAFDELVRYGA